MTVVIISKGDKLKKVYSEIVKFEENEGEFSFWIAGEPRIDIPRNKTDTILLLSDNGDVLFKYERRKKR